MVCSHQKACLASCYIDFELIYSIAHQQLLKIFEIHDCSLMFVHSNSMCFDRLDLFLLLTYALNIYDSTNNAQWLCSQKGFGFASIWDFGAAIELRAVHCSAENRESETETDGQFFKFLIFVKLICLSFILPENILLVSDFPWTKQYSYWFHSSTFCTVPIVFTFAFSILSSSSRPLKTLLLDFYRIDLLLKK